MWVHCKSWFYSTIPAYIGFFMFVNLSIWSNICVRCDSINGIHKTQLRTSMFPLLIFILQWRKKLQWINSTCCFSFQVFICTSVLGHSAFLSLCKSKHNILNLKFRLSSNSTKVMVLFPTISPFTLKENAANSIYIQTHL